MLSILTIKLPKGINKDINTINRGLRKARLEAIQGLQGLTRIPSTEEKLFENIGFNPRIKKGEIKSSDRVVMITIAEKKCNKITFVMDSLLDKSMKEVFSFYHILGAKVVHHNLPFLDFLNEKKEIENPGL